VDSFSFWNQHTTSEEVFTKRKKGEDKTGTEKKVKQTHNHEN